MMLAWVLRLALGLNVVVPALPLEDVPPATPAVIDLTWNAPPDCGSAEDVHARISELLTERPNGEGVATVVADIEVESGGVRMTLSTTFGGATDVRDVSSASCVALAEATALLLAVSLEPGLEPDPGRIPKPDAENEDPEAREPQPVPPQGALPPPVLPRVAETTPEVMVTDRPDAGRPPSRPRNVWLHGLAAAGAERGAVQDLTGSVRLGLGVGGQVWAAEVMGTYLLPRRHPEGLFQVGLAGARGCWTPGSELWRALLCGGAEFGGLRVDSRGLEPSRTRLGPYLGPAASIGALRRRDRVGFVLRAEAMVRAFGSQTVDETQAVLTEQRVVSLRLSLGVQFDLLGPPR